MLDILIAVGVTVGILTLVAIFFVGYIWFDERFLCPCSDHERNKVKELE